MNELGLTLACGRYDRTEPLIDGSLVPEGIALRVVPLSPPEAFWRMLRHAEFDISEMSLSAYLTLVSRGDQRFVAIPVFLSRAFRHSAFFVHVNAGISEPADLRGKRVGTPEYHLTTGVWARGLLLHEFGIRPDEFTWHTGGQRQAGRQERIAVHLPEGVHLSSIPADRTLDEMIEVGEMDAVIVPDVPASFETGSPNVRRLFPDFRRVEADYYRRTGIFPIMHTVVIRRDVYERHPWVAQSLFKAFSEAKDRAVRALYDANALRCTLPWVVAEIEEERAVFGPDPWPYGFDPNRVTLETLQQYLGEQGLLDSTVDLRSAFAPSTLEAYRR